MTMQQVDWVTIPASRLYELEAREDELAILNSKARLEAGTHDASAVGVLAAVMACAKAWEPEARLLGNVRAGDIARACCDGMKALLAARCN